MNFDSVIVSRLNALVGLSPWFDTLLVFLTNHLGYLLIVGSLIYWYIHASRDKGSVRLFLFVFLSVILSRLVFTEIIRYIWYRPRPLAVLHDLQLILPKEMTASFPSGHVSMYFALAFAMFYLDKKIGAWYLSFATLIALSRVILGFHYMTDIIGGFLVAWVSVIIIKCALEHRLE